MKELSLNVLDIAMNSVKAGAKRIAVTLDENSKGIVTLVITDDGCGMSKETLARVTDPFCTSRTTRKVGMGVPLLKLASEQTGGSFSIVSQSVADSPLSHGTTVTASFDTKSIDFTPLGDIVGTLCVLIQGSPDIDFLFRHTAPSRTVELDTSEIRSVLGDVPLNSPEVLEWIKENLNEQYTT